MENYVDKAINELENYKTLRAAAHNIESDIQRLQRKVRRAAQGPSCNLVASYSAQPSGHSSAGTYNFETVANALIAKNEELVNTVEKIQDIETALDRLGTEVCMPDYQRVLILWHVEELSKEEICKAMNYESRQSIYNLYKRAIKKFAIILFGSVALDNYTNEGI